MPAAAVVMTSRRRSTPRPSHDRRRLRRPALDRRGRHGRRRARHLRRRADRLRHGRAQHQHKDCLGSCHNHGFTLAGTLYESATDNTGYAGATITIVDNNGTSYPLVVQANGNFYTTAAIAFPVTSQRRRLPVRRVDVGDVDDRRVQLVPRAKRRLGRSDALAVARPRVAAGGMDERARRDRPRRGAGGSRGRGALAPAWRA